PGSPLDIPQRITPYALATRFPASDRVGAWIPMAASSFAHAWVESGEMLRTSTPRVWKSLLLCRSTTCCMHPPQPGPMLKYRRTALRPRNWARETGPPSAEGSVNAGAASPTRRAAVFAGVDPLLQAAPDITTSTRAVARRESHLGLISTPPGWPDGAETPPRRSPRERG